MDTVSAPAKPPRMRQACGECHKAKVRCSGEKTGCMRCLNADLQCEYAVSMVGRAPKRKRRRMNTGPGTFVSSVPEAVSNHGPSEDQSQSLDELASDFHFPTDFSFQSWTNDYTLDLIQSFTQVNSQEDVILTSDEAILAEDNIDLTSPDTLPLVFDTGPPKVDLNDSQAFQQLNPARNDEIPDLAKVDRSRQALTQAQCSGKSNTLQVLNLVTMVGQLEEQVQETEAAVDKILRLNKASVADIIKIVGDGESRTCKSCRALVPTAVNLIMTLYESCLSSNNTARCSNLDVTPCRKFPKLQYGVFSIEPDDEIWFRNQLLARELRHSLKLIQTLTKNCLKYSCGNADCGSIKWYVRMEEQAKSLIASVES